MLVVAAVTARAMTELAVRDGYDVVALDLFGDADTRAASVEWMPVGATDSSRIDADRFLAALTEQARRGTVVGWLAGAGFEARLDLLAAGARILPLIGNPAAAVQRARDPATFFALLDRIEVPHPPVRWIPPVLGDAAGWLRKDARGTGGWHVRSWAADRSDTCSRAADTGPIYYQREQPGVAMSATFIANGREACLLGYNELLSRRFGSRPYVYSGVIGPVTVPDAADRVVRRALQALSAETPLHGLGSLDFLLEGEAVSVLEVNPRPSASMALYERVRFSKASSGPPESAPTHGLIEAHVRACRSGELPQVVADPVSVAAQNAPCVRGVRVVFARRPLLIDADCSARLAAWPGLHDRPAAGTRLAPGDPVCSLSTAADTAEQVKTRLSERRKALLDTLEKPT